MLALVRHSRIADGLPLSGAERSCKDITRMTEFGPTADMQRLTHSISSSVRIKAPSTLRCQIRGAIGCVSLVEKCVLNTGSDGGNQGNGANSSHFLPAPPLLDRRRASLRHPRFPASVR